MRQKGLKVLKNIFSIYTLLVCFVCLIIFMVTLAMVGNDAIYLRFPQYSNFVNFDGSTWLVFETNENYLDYYRRKPSPIEGIKEKKEQEEWEALSQMPPEKLAHKRLLEREKLIKKIHFNAEKDIVHLLPILFISLALFIIHGAFYRKQKHSKNFTR